MLEPRRPFEVLVAQATDAEGRPWIIWTMDPEFEGDLWTQIQRTMVDDEIFDILDEVRRGAGLED